MNANKLNTKNEKVMKRRLCFWMAILAIVLMFFRGPVPSMPLSAWFTIVVTITVTINIANVIIEWVCFRFFSGENEGAEV